MARCVNIDWLEVYVLEPPDKYPLDVDYFVRQGYEVRARPYGTRVYSQMFTLVDQWGDGFLEIRRDPLANTDKNKQSFLEPYAAHIRLTNKWCYAKDPIGVLRQFLIKHNYTLRSIYRIDICLDFERFDKGDDPADFMRRYMQGRYTKINQSRIAAHGVDSWESRIWNSVSWGQSSSMVSTKFYNKTLELNQAHDKPYIRYAWMDAGLIHDAATMQNRKPDGTLYKPSIWRVEFSIKSSAAKWYVITDCNGRKKKQLRYSHTLDLYDSRQKLLFVFASLCHFYFHFKVFKQGVRKDRCADKVLFDIKTGDVIYRPVRLASEKADNRSKILKIIRQLQEFQMYVLEERPRRALSHVIDWFESLLVNQDIRDYSELAEVRRVHELFMRPVEQISEADILQLDSQLAQQISLQFR